MKHACSHGPYMFMFCFGMLHPSGLTRNPSSMNIIIIIIISYINEIWHLKYGGRHGFLFLFFRWGAQKKIKIAKEIHGLIIWYLKYGGDMDLFKLGSGVEPPKKHLSLSPKKIHGLYNKPKPKLSTPKNFKKTQNKTKQKTQIYIVIWSQINIYIYIYIYNGLSKTLHVTITHVFHYSLPFFRTSLHVR